MKTGHELSVAKVCEAFWEAEDRLSLLSWSAQDVAIWPLVRMKLYYGITEAIGLLDAPHPVVGRTSTSTDTRSLDDIWRELDVTCRVPMSAGWTGAFQRLFPRRRYAILSANRRINGQDIYTAALRAELGDRALLLAGSIGDQVEEGSVDYKALRRLFHVHYRPPRESAPAPTSVNPTWEALREHFSRTLSVDIEGMVNAATILRGFLAERRGFREFFTRYPVDTLFIVNAYSRPGVSEGARDAGARIVELQHGFISRYHLGYSWPGRPIVPYAPDSLWCFGEFWPSVTPLPGQMTTRIIGAPYVHELSRSPRSRVGNRAVFTSQGVIGRRLLDIALEVARRRQDRDIVFRLHPSEILGDYEEILGARSNVPGNFSLSHRDPNIFSLLATAEVQVGAFSTTLLEGMALGARTIVVDLPGVEYMAPVLERGDALLVRSTEELVDRLDHAPLASNPAFYYAKPARRLLLNRGSALS